MTGYEAYITYLAIKNHFTQKSYDFFKYNGKVKVPVSTYEKRKDKLFYDKLAKQDDLINFLVVNIVDNPKAYIRDLVYSDKAEKKYSDWLKNQQSLSYIFKQELIKLNQDFNANFVCKNNQYPILLTEYLRKEISLDTLCLLLEFSGALKHWNKELHDDLIWEEYSLKIVKYTPFIKCDKTKLKKIVVDYYT